MYGIFVQTSRGLQWAANAPDEETAKAQIAAGDFDSPDVEFVFALPGLTAFRDLAQEGSDTN